MALVRAVSIALSLLAFATAFADQAPKSNKQDAETRVVCRDLPRYESRIKERVCGSPEQVARLERERNEVTVLRGERVFPPNGDARTTTTFE